MSSGAAPALPLVDPRTPIDLTNCDREPIHIPGAIQPHGALLGWHERDDRIVVASANAAALLGVAHDAVIGERLGALIGDTGARAIRDAFQRHEARRETSARLRHAGILVDVTAYRSDGLAIIEIERADATADVSPTAFRDVIHETLRHVESATSIRSLAESIAEQMRRISGFDRVWVYRFHEDWHGEIIGEAKRDDIEPWLGLHYPASDIPAQARALFLKNWLRMIPDIGFVPVPLTPGVNPLTNGPLDLSLSVLRSVSPIHIEYLTNMGVTASLVISLIHRGRLWGLISGHHYSGIKYVPRGTRTTCEFLAQALSLQLGMAEQVEDRDHALAIRAVETALRERLSTSDDYRGTLLSGSPNLLDLTRSTGAAFYEEGVVSTVGQTPTVEQLGELGAWLGARRESLFHTTMLGKHFPPAAEYAACASGLLAVSLSSSRPRFMLWFRPERRQTISWAGEPSKSAEMTADGVLRLSPRGSFALWEEERRGTSAPWEQVEIDAATDLRRSALDLLLRRAEEVGLLNDELQTSMEELQQSTTELESQADELIAQRTERESLLGRERAARGEAERANRVKAEFLAMMSHELRTPLNAIAGYAQILEIGARGPVTEQQKIDLGRIQQNQRHLLGIVNSILNFAKVEAGQISIEKRRIDLRTVITEIGALVLPQLATNGLRLEALPGDEPLMVIADAERTRQVILNLLSNAIKFTPAGGDIRIGARRVGATVAIDVSDTGRGVPLNRLEAIFDPFVQIDRHTAPRGEEGVGLGLAISRDLARKMGGELTATSTEGTGSTFTLSLPATD